MKVGINRYIPTSEYTCYKAANWIYLGNTKGRGRQDRHTQYLSSPKAIYTYSLIEDFRSYLKGEKDFKAVMIDD
jgi:hypothetical protein